MGFSALNMVPSVSGNINPATHKELKLLQNEGSRSLVNVWREREWLLQTVYLLISPYLASLFKSTAKLKSTGILSQRRGFQVTWRTI